MSRPVARRRGQPIAAFALLLAGWIGTRVVLVQGAATEQPAPRAQHGPVVAQHDARPFGAAAHPAPSDLAAARVAAAAIAVAIPQAWSAPGRAPLALPTDPAPLPLPAVAEPVRTLSAVAGGHELMWLAALAQMPLVLPLPPGFAAPRPAAPSFRAPARWSADGWLLLRRDGALPAIGPAPASYGASQLGAVIRYRLAPADPHRPALYLRGAAALGAVRQEEVAAGLAVRPVPGVPVAALAELRATRDVGGTRARPALALVTELRPLRLPAGAVAEAYAQGGWVGGKGATAFVDGQLRVERRLAGLAGAELSAGAGAWGGAQQGAARLDVGPTATLKLRIGEAGARVSADWRFRVAGDARPASGPALTLSAGF